MSASLPFVTCFCHISAAIHQLPPSYSCVLPRQARHHCPAPMGARPMVMKCVFPSSLSGQLPMFVTMLVDSVSRKFPFISYIPTCTCTPSRTCARDLPSATARSFPGSFEFSQKAPVKHSPFRSDHNWVTKPRVSSGLCR